MRTLSLAAFFLVSVAYVATQEVTPCSTSADCPTDQCCVATYRPRGKRQDLPGTCHLLGKESDPCFVNANHYLPEQLYYVQCPCGAATSCQPNGIVDMPLGPMGICSA